MATLKVQAQIKQNAEEISSYFADLSKWEKSIKKRDGKLRGSESGSIRKPPVRVGSGTVQATHTVVDAPKTKTTSAAKHTYDTGYDKWNNFDVDSALEQIDKQEKQAITVAENEDEIDIAALTPASIVKSKSVVVKTIPVPSARGIATNRNAEEAERERGNDEFKAGNFQAAVKAYTICLGLKAKNYVAFSNRAMAYLKLKEFTRAELDCTHALDIEPHHVKSLIRRSTARNSLGKHRAALKDIEAALELEPSNKQCRSECQRTKELLRSCVNRAPMVTIQPTWHNATNSDDALTSGSRIDDDNTLEVFSGPDLPIAY